MKKEYKYFVSYASWSEKGQAFGNTILSMNKARITGNVKDAIERYIEKENGFEKIVLLNIVKLN